MRHGFLPLVEMTVFEMTPRDGSTILSVTVVMHGCIVYGPKEGKLGARSALEEGMSWTSVPLCPVGALAGSQGGGTCMVVATFNEDTQWQE